MFLRSLQFSTFLVLALLLWISSAPLVSADERDRYHDQWRGAKAAQAELVKINARDLTAVTPFMSDGCGKWEPIGVCVKANIFREGPIVKPMWSYYYTDIAFESTRRPTGSLIIPKVYTSLFTHAAYILLSTVGVSTVPQNMAHYSIAQQKNRIPQFQGGAPSGTSSTLMSAMGDDLHFGAFPYAGLIGNATASGSDRVIAEFPLYKSIWSPFTMVHKYQYNTRPADKRDPNSRQFYLPYVALNPFNVMYHYYEVVSQLNPYYRERALPLGSPRNMLGMQLAVNAQTREKPIEHFGIHANAGHINRQDSEREQSGMGQGYSFWSMTGYKGDSLYAAQFAAPTAVVSWDAINSRETNRQEPTKALVEQKDYIQFIKPYYNYKSGEIKGDPSHFLGHLPNPDDLPRDKNKEGLGGWPKGCKERYVEDKQEKGSQRHSASPKYDFPTDYRVASRVVESKVYPANHYILTGWTNVWGCPYDYIPLGGKDGEVEKLS